MANDGSLKFDTKLDTDGFEAGEVSLKKAMDRLSKSYDRLANQISKAFFGIGKSFEGASDGSKEVSEGIDQVTDSTRNAKNEAVELEKQMKIIQHPDIASEKSMVPTQEYLEVSKAVEKARVALDKLLERQQKMESTGVKKNSQAYKNLQYDIDQARNSLIAMQSDQKSMQEDGSAFVDNLKRARQEAEKMSRISITGLSDTDNTGPSQLPQTITVDPADLGYNQKAIEFVEQYGQGLSEAEQHTNEFRQEISTLEKQLKELDSQGLYFGDDEYDTAFMKLAKVKQALVDYKKEMLSPTPEQKLIDSKSLQGEVDSLKRKLRLLAEDGKTFGNTLYDSTYKALGEAQAKLTEYRRDLTKPAKIPIEFDANSFEGQRQRLQKELLELESRGISLGNDTYDQKYAELQKVIQAEKEYKKALTDVNKEQQQVKKSADQVGKSLDQMGKSSKGAENALVKSFFKIGNMFKMMLVRMAMRSVVNGIKEGFQNLAQYSDQTNGSISGLLSSLTYLKNSLAASFAPILNIVVPTLSILIDTIAQAIAWIGQLIAILTGSGTFIKAKKVQEDYAAGLKKTGGAAKKAGKDAQKALAPFDQLTVLQEKSNSGGGGGSGGGVDPSDMFETVAVSSELASMLDLVTSKMLDLAEIFKQGFEFGLGDPTARMETIRNGMKSISQSLKEIFTDPAVLDASRQWADITIRNLGMIVGSVASIGLTIGANLIGGLSIYLEEAKDRIKQYLINMFDISGQTSTIVANFSAAAAEIFSVFAGENGQMFTANLIGFFVEGFMGVTELAAKYGRDILDALLTPITKNQEKFKSAFDGMLEIGAQVMGDLKEIVTESFEKMNDVYDAHIKPMFEAFRDGLTEIYGVALEAFETHILPAIKKVADKFSEFRKSHLQPLIDKFIEFGGKIADTVTVIWDEALKPFFLWAVDTFAPNIGSVIEGIGTIFDGLLKTVAEVASSLLDALGGVLDFIQGVFKGDIELAIEGIKTVFKGVFNGIIIIVENAVNGIVRALNKISFDVPDWIPNLKGKSFGFNLPEVRIPRLATGTVVPPRAGEFMAILGDNNQDTEVVSPLGTMKQAFLEAMSEFGGMRGNEDTPVILELDGETILQTTVGKNQRQWQRTGRNILI